MQNLYVFLDLQRKIRALHWIGPAMVGAKLDRGLPEVKSLIDDAVTNFLQTNSSELPRYSRASILKINELDFVAKSWNICQQLVTVS